ncbi:hypothetical protein L1887_37689 [Cichorium endivia]|nr:hypothetical protein L1887_37689 [Cichorium endivia]
MGASCHHGVTVPGNGISSPLFFIASYGVCGELGTNIADENSTSSLSVVPPPPFSGNSLSSPAKNLLASIKSLIHPFAFRFQIRFKIKNPVHHNLIPIVNLAVVEKREEKEREAVDKDDREIYVSVGIPFFN